MRPTLKEDMYLEVSENVSKVTKQLMQAVDTLKKINDVIDNNSKFPESLFQISILTKNTLKQLQN